MMSSHNQQLTNFVEKFKNQIEFSLIQQMKKQKPGDTGSISDNLTQTLGSSNLMLSNIRQMQ